MCGTCRPALGPLCMTHRGGGMAGVREGEGESVNGNRGKRLLFCIREKKGEEVGKNAGN